MSLIGTEETDSVEQRGRPQNLYAAEIAQTYHINAFHIMNILFKILLINHIFNCSLFQPPYKKEFKVYEWKRELDGTTPGPHNY